MHSLTIQFSLLDTHQNIFLLLMVVFLSCGCSYPFTFDSPSYRTLGIGLAGRKDHSKKPITVILLALHTGLEVRITKVQVIELLMTCSVTLVNYSVSVPQFPQLYMTAVTISAWPIHRESLITDMLASNLSIPGGRVDREALNVEFERWISAVLFLARPGYGMTLRVSSEDNRE